MLVKNAMTSGKIHTLSPRDGFGKIVRFLVKNKISGAPVINKKGKLVGIVSEKDLFYKLFPSPKKFYKDPEYYMDFNRIEADALAVKKLKAKDFMTRKLVTIGPEEHILKACSLFIKHEIRRLPVVDKGKLIGVVTTNDVYKRFLTVLSSIKDK